LGAIILSEETRLAENKLIILYLLNKMGVSLSNTDICQFAMERNIMDYISVQQCLTDLTTAEWLDSYTDNGSTRYTITKEGNEILSLFHNRITEWLLSAANEYILNNKQRIKNEYEISANYFPEINGDYLVKCEVCGLGGARIMELAGFEVLPKSTDERSDIIQTIKFGNAENVINFCKGIQYGSPIDSHVECEPWDMPGYKDKVIMAAGAFIQGSSIELSADAPIRPPYIAYMQGGLTFDHAKIGILIALNNIIKNNISK